MTPAPARLRHDIHNILRAAVDAVDPPRLIASAHARGLLDVRTITDPVHLVCAGKAAWPMARAFCAHVPRLAHGVVAGPVSGGAELPPQLEWIDAAHPTPDARSERAARRAMALAAESRHAGTLVVLLSGGASSMLALPAPGVGLHEKAAASRALMDAGVPIDELNCVRKHLSAIKGGQLAAAAGPVLTLALSDVHGPVEDDPAVIGSGPTVGDPTTFAEALAVVERAGVRVAEAVRARLSAGARGEIPETPRPAAAALDRSVYHVIGGRRTAVAGAGAEAARLGYRVVVVERPTNGEARDAGRQFAAEAIRVAADAGRPMCVIAAGETTVRVRGSGRGGRNQEFVLGALGLLHGRAAVLASAGTDGIDGPTDAAGAIADGSSLARSQDAGLSARQALEDNASYAFFERLSDLVVWGPTGTNVGDVHVLLILPSAANP